jgi:predicted Zn-dependent peptidase
METEPLVRNILEQSEVIESLTPAAVQDVARQLLNPANQIQLTMLPEG